MPYYEEYPGSHRLKLPLHEHESDTQSGRHCRHVGSRHDALQTALAEDHHQFPDHHDILPRETCPRCTGEPHGHEKYPVLITEIDGWYLEAMERLNQWGLYKLAEDGQPNPWTGFPSTQIDELFDHTREDGDREILIVLQSALDFLTAAPNDRRNHYDTLAARVDDPEDILAMVRAHR